MIDFGLLKEPVMILLVISSLFGMQGFYIPFMFVMNMAAEKNISAELAGLLLPIIGVTNTFGKSF